MSTPRIHYKDRNVGQQGRPQRERYRAEDRIQSESNHMQCVRRQHRV
jgi:hypothetical protein